MTAGRGSPTGMALDSPERVERLALLDIVPTKTVFDRINAPVAHAYFHWFMLARPSPLPETLIGGDPGFWLDTVFGAWSGAAAAFTPEALAAYRRGFMTTGGPARQLRRLPRRGRHRLQARCRRPRCGAQDRLPDPACCGARPGSSAGPMATRSRCGPTMPADLRGHGVPGGHFLPEEAPAETPGGVCSVFFSPPPPAGAR